MKLSHDRIDRPECVQSKFESNLLPDFYEKMADALLTPLRLSTGKTVVFDKDFRFKEEKTTSKITAVAVFCFGCLIFPISLPLTLVGYLFRKLSTSYSNALFTISEVFMDEIETGSLKSSEIEYFARNFASSSSYYNCSDAVLLAARYGNLNVLKSLKKAKIKVEETKVPFDQLCFQDDEKYENDEVTALDVACAEGQEEVVKYLIRNGASLERKNQLLELALKNDHMDIAKLLVKKGASIPKEDITKFYPSSDVPIKRSKKIVEFLSEEFGLPSTTFKKRSGNILQIDCFKPRLKKDCLEVFTEFAERIEKNPKLDIRVTFTCEKGLDYGALRKEFLTTLLEGVSVKWGLSKGIPDKGMTKKQLNQLGNVIGWLLVHEYTVGDLFAPGIIKPLATFLGDEKHDFLPENVLGMYLIYDPSAKHLQPLIDFLNWDGEVVRAESHLDFLKSSFETMAISPEDTDWFNEPSFESLDIAKLIEYREKWSSLLLEAYNYPHYRKKVEQLWEIDLGYNNQTFSSDGTWFDDSITTNEEEVNFVLERIIGSVDIHQLLSKVKINSEGESSHFEDTIVSWLLSLGEGDIRKFLRCATGTPSIPVGDDFIEIDIKNSDGIVVQACFNKITIPRTFTISDIIDEFNGLIQSEGLDYNDA